MSPADARSLALVALIAVAPLALVLMVALLRGYTITIHLVRDQRPHDERGSWDEESVIVWGSLAVALALLAWILTR
jgi:hypothetical protein